MVPLLALLFPVVRTHPRRLTLAATMALIGKAFEFAWFAIPGRGWPAALTYVLALGGFSLLCSVWLPMAHRHRGDRELAAAEVPA